jgi:hypothetical protein
MENMAVPQVITSRATICTHHLTSVYLSKQEEIPTFTHLL